VGSAVGAMGLTLEEGGSGDTTSNQQWMSNICQNQLNESISQLLNQITCQQESCSLTHRRQS